MEDKIMEKKCYEFTHLSRINCSMLGFSTLYTFNDMVRTAIRTYREIEENVR